MDWKSLIEDLQAVGITQIEIGKAVGRSQAWVADIVRGRYEDIKWTDGESIRRLHSERCATKAAA